MGGFIVRNLNDSKLKNLANDHSDSNIFIRLPSNNKHHVSPIKTLKTDLEEKCKIYLEQRSFLSNIQAIDKIIILGDFNARVGRVVDI